MGKKNFPDETATTDKGASESSAACETCKCKIEVGATNVKFTFYHTFILYTRYINGQEVKTFYRFGPETGTPYPNKSNVKYFNIPRGKIPKDGIDRGESSKIIFIELIPYGVTYKVHGDILGMVYMKKKIGKTQENH